MTMTETDKKRLMPTVCRAGAWLLVELGEDPAREGLQRTPERVAKALAS